jgi:SAM-dependent methyltransferase
VRYLYPLSSAKADSLIGALDIASGDLVIDLGCGNGGLLIDAIARGNCRGVGVEADATLLTLADAEARRRGAVQRLQLIHQPVAEYAAASGVADTIICLGGTATFGGLGAAAARCYELLRVGGRLLLGDFFWRRSPPAAYRELLGPAALTVPALGANARITVNAGFEQQLTTLASESEWDAFETARYRSALADAERLAASTAGETAAAPARQRAQSLYQAYWRHGRDALGFGLHVFRKPRGPMRLVPSA